MDNVGINLNDRNVNLIVFGSKILGQYITEIKNKDLGYYNSKITILEDNIRIINSLKLDIKNIEFYNVLTPSGFSLRG
ncbi:hypothetical protein CRG86_009670 [Photobacterium leiognathi]|uniref:hypothetical protein n=1 Tax=Photobacterium leiognathi TaxID=553611 RepID=UPI000C034284|nr:hypothetical protein [Photobacterium leiognathi]PHZ58338.1 hypothetical protein CRG86_009670 [Photobacterium leiognathi]